jgi:hypothetical protein
MELQELQALLSELLQAIEIMISSGEHFPDELQGMIAQTLELLYSRIEELSTQEPEAPTYTPSPTTSNMPSSNVAGMNYNPQTQDLQVQFLGKHPNRNGSVYEYPNIPKPMAELLLSGAIPARTDGSNKWGSWYRGKNPSAGASVFTLLKNRNVPFQRLS